MRLQIRGEYPPDRNQLHDQVRAAVGHRCIRCGHPAETVNRPALCDAACRHPPDQKRKQRILTVHHLDGNKSNNRWWNLLALCQVCHLCVQARVIPERSWLFEHSAWFKPYIAGFYASYYDRVEITREEAMENLDQWLMLGQPWLYDGSML